MKQEAMNYYPVFLKITDRSCVVCGGGEVALRKAKALLEHGARVTVVSPEFDPGLLSLAENGAVQVIARDYRDGDLDAAFLAIAATDNRNINRQIAAEARSKGCLINTVDDADNSDFIVPSYLERGDITIAISTSGRSPALARKLRTRLETEFGAEYAALVHLIGEIREEAREKGFKLSGDLWQEALDLEPLLSLLKSGKVDEARAAIMRNIMPAVK
jgi:siroheme synthase-like protein